MSRFMASGGIGSTRQDYLTHVTLMLGRRLLKTEIKLTDTLRKKGLSAVQIAEVHCKITGESMIYPKGHEKAGRGRFHIDPR